MIRIAIHGATGRMGQAVGAVIDETAGLEVVVLFTSADDPALGRERGGVRLRSLAAEPLDAVDAVIDFSAAEALGPLTRACQASSTPLVSGTTGLGDSAREGLHALSAAAPVVHAPNMSAGVTLLFHLAEQAASGLRDFDAEIVEMHHRHKVDAPSGTALRLAEHVAQARGLDPSEVIRDQRAGAVGPRTDEEIGVMTLRGGGVVGDHTLHLVSLGERLELTHRAMDRSIFARGAVRAARWIVGRTPGLYSMADVLGLRVS